MAAVPPLGIHLLPLPAPSAAGFGPFLINLGKSGSCREEPTWGGCRGRGDVCPRPPPYSSELNPPTSHQRLPWARALAEGQQLLLGAATGAAGASGAGGGQAGGAVAIEAPKEIGWKRAGRGEAPAGALPIILGVPVLGRGPRAQHSPKAARGGRLQWVPPHRATRVRTNSRPHSLSAGSSVAPGAAASRARAASTQRRMARGGTAPPRAGTGVAAPTAPPLISPPTALSQKHVRGAAICGSARHGTGCSRG